MPNRWRHPANCSGLLYFFRPVFRITRGSVSKLTQLSFTPLSLSWMENQATGNASRKCSKRSVSCSIAQALNSCKPVYPDNLLKKMWGCLGVSAGAWGCSGLKVFLNFLVNKTMTEDPVPKLWMSWSQYLVLRSSPPSRLLSTEQIKVALGQEELMCGVHDFRAA